MATIRRTEKTVVSLTADEFELLKKASARAGLSIASYTRMAAIASARMEQAQDRAPNESRSAIHTSFDRRYDKP